MRSKFYDLTKQNCSMNSSQQHCVHPVAHCGLTDLFQGSDINSPHPSRSDVDGTCAKMLNFSQTGGMFASQEFGFGSIQLLGFISSCKLRCVTICTWLQHARLCHTASWIQAPGQSKYVSASCDTRARVWSTAHFRRGGKTRPRDV